MTTEDGPAEMTFEQALGRLEAVVGAMEAGDLNAMLRRGRTWTVAPDC